MANAHTASHTNTTPGHGGAGHGSGKSYAIGFILSVILTAIPFALVMSHSLPRSTILEAVVVMAIIQIVVHLVYFLHMNGSSEQRWNVMAFAFTALIIAIVCGGSLWILHYMNVNMAVG